MCLLNPGIDQSTPISICAPRSARFFAVKRPQSENKPINNNIHLRSAICLLLRGQTSASGNKPINNNIHLRFAICSLFRGQTSAEVVLCLLNPGIDQSTPIFICAPRYAHFFAVKRPRFAACWQATTNLRSNARTEIKLPAI